MKIKDIKSLAEIMSNYDLSNIEISEQDTSIKLSRNTLQTPTAVYTVETPQQPAKQSINNSASFEETSIVSPMVGLYYSSAEPGAKPFVSEGQQVKKGDVLCIIEAMKMMNEITSEKDCIITKILCEDEQLVEYGQPLFEVKEN